MMCMTTEFMISRLGTADLNFNETGLIRGRWLAVCTVGFLGLWSWVVRVFVILKKGVS